MAMEYEQRFCRITVSNGFLPTVSNGFPPTARKLAGTALLLWRAFARWSPWFPTGRIVRSGCVVKLRPEEIAAYDAPFPSEEYKAAARAFPQLIPFDANNPAVSGNWAAWERLGRWEKPFLCVFGENDPILGQLDRVLIAHVPGARDQRHERIWGGHVIQEDRGDELARRLVEFIRDIRSRTHLALNFYLSAVNRTMRTPVEGPSIGVLLCESRSGPIVEFALETINQPIGVSTYHVTRELPPPIQEEMPTVENLREVVNKLRSEMDTLRKEPPDEK